MGGLEPNTILTISGISGCGKSALINTLETDLIDLNPNQDIVVLSFNFEMLSYRQVGRKLSYKLKKTTSELYSGTDEGKLTEDDVKTLQEAAEPIKSYPIYYCDIPGTVKDIEGTIVYFQEVVAKGK
jgi:replicative DNA helicase